MTARAVPMPPDPADLDPAAFELRAETAAALRRMERDGRAFPCGELFPGAFPEPKRAPAAPVQSDLFTEA